MRTTLTRGLEDSPDVTALINGMALGLRHEAPNDIEDPFQQTGTLHLFAVAGLHVGIIAQLLWILASLLRLPRLAAAALIIPCLFFYSAITGFHVSSLRAATMAAFLLGGIFFDRPVLALNSLAGAALLILAFDTNQLFTSGFQLSFAVVGAILVWQNSIFRVLLRPAETDPFLPRSLVSRSPPILRAQLPAGRERHFGLRRSLGGFAASYHLVFLSRHADLAAREPHGGADRILRLGGWPDVAGGIDLFAGALACFQQRELEPRSNHS